MSQEEAPKMSQEECLTVLRKFVEKSPIPGIQKQTLHNITKVYNCSLTFIRYIHIFTDKCFSLSLPNKGPGTAKPWPTFLMRFDFIMKKIFELEL